MHELGLPLSFLIMFGGVPLCWMIGLAAIKWAEGQSLYPPEPQADEDEDSRP